jgi:hypothetical protein
MGNILYFSRFQLIASFAGYVSWIGRYADSDCVLVQILYECGAVPFVRTNVPQTLMESPPTTMCLVPFFIRRV